ncbi:MAG: trypsin-like serine protease [Burkholderiales bacterium]
MSRRILLSTLLCLATPAHALVGGALDANLASSPFAGAGAVIVNGGTFSGVLLDPWHVLTAAHVVAGRPAAAIQFRLNAGAAETLSAAAVTVHPGYAGTTPGSDGVWHDDLAIVRLAAPATSASGYPLYTGPAAGQTIALAGYGGTGDGSAGVTAAASPGLKRSGQNRVDLVLPDDDGSGADEVFIFDFDGPTAASNVFGAAAPANLTLGANLEAQFAGGDSGSPVFINDNGIWKIFGVANFNGSTTGLPGSNVLFGSVGGGSLVAPYAGWIAQTVTTPVPEADTWAMLLAGLGVVSRAAARRRRI